MRSDTDEILVIEETDITASWATGGSRTHDERRRKRLHVLAWERARWSDGWNMSSRGARRRSWGDGSRRLMRDEGGSWISKILEGSWGCWRRGLRLVGCTGGLWEERDGLISRCLKTLWGYVRRWVDALIIVSMFSLCWTELMCCAFGFLVDSWCTGAGSDV